MHTRAEEMLKALTALSRIETILGQRGISPTAETEEPAGRDGWAEFSHVCDQGGQAHLAWSLQIGAVPRRREESERMTITVQLGFGRSGDHHGGCIALTHDPIGNKWKASAVVELGDAATLSASWHDLKSRFVLAEKERALNEPTAVALLVAMAAVCLESNLVAAALKPISKT